MLFLPSFNLFYYPVYVVRICVLTKVRHPWRLTCAMTELKYVFNLIWDAFIILLSINASCSQYCTEGVGMQCAMHPPMTINGTWSADPAQTPLYLFLSFRFWQAFWTSFYIRFQANGTRFHWSGYFIPA